MHELIVYSLLAATALAVLLFFSALFYGRNALGLAAYCLAVAAWSAVLLLSVLPSTEALGGRLVVMGGFVVAAYLHAAFDFTQEKRFGTVRMWYIAATGLFLVQLLYPGLLFDPPTRRAGPYFWPTIVFASAAATVPLARLWTARRKASRDQRPQLLRLALAGGCGYVGSVSTAISFSYGVFAPLGILIVLCSLGLLAYVVHYQQPTSMQRLAERNLAYSVLSALLSTVFVFVVILAAQMSGLPGVGTSRLKLLLVAGLIALAFEPVRRRSQEAIGKRLLRHAAHAPELAAALASQEQRANQAARLAELGTFASAVAHEVRGPLGVLKAQLRLREGAPLDQATMASMQLQIGRAERFAEDLLRYGRPRPLQIRTNDLTPLLELGFTSARDALGVSPRNAHGSGAQGHLGTNPQVVTLLVESPNGLRLEADASQLLQVLMILFENALLAVDGNPRPVVRARAATDGGHVRIRIDDNGPGIAADVMPRLFQPFATGRNHSDTGKRRGTGLGLAIARGIVERHGGSITADTSDLGGASFALLLPLAQPMMAAATGEP